MRLPYSLLLVILCLCCLLTGCGDAAPATDTQPVTEAVLTPTEPVQTIPETTDATVPASTEAPEPTTPTRETLAWEDTPYGELTAEQKQALVEPSLAPPEVPEGPCHFFDDAAFIGDSISYSLMVYNTRHGGLGSPLFLVRGSLSLHNTQNGMMEVYFQGKNMAPWDALAASGVKKVFLHLGMNDIGYWGIDDTMLHWETFLGHIREVCPDIEVYIQSLTPVWFRVQEKLLNNDNVDLYNERLKEFAEANGCHFVNIAPYFKDYTGGLAKPYCADDFVHMTEEGNEVWTRVLLAYAAEQEKENP